MSGQGQMFPDGEDLPIFSGTASTATETPYVVDISEPLEQLGFAACKSCHDTGWIWRGPPWRSNALGTYRTARCWCALGQATRP